MYSLSRRDSRKQWKRKNCKSAQTNHWNSELNIHRTLDIFYCRLCNLWSWLTALLGERHTHRILSHILLAMPTFPIRTQILILFKHMHRTILCVRCTHFILFTESIGQTSHRRSRCLVVCVYSHSKVVDVFSSLKDGADGSILFAVDTSKPKYERQRSQKIASTAEWIYPFEFGVEKMSMISEWVCILIIAHLR